MYCRKPVAELATLLNEAFLIKPTKEDGRFFYVEEQKVEKEKIYHQRSTDADERIKQLLADAEKFLAICGSGYNHSTEYDLFVRCLSEQTIVENGKRGLCTKEDGGMGSSMMQNPSDPETTFRSKAGKEHRGYAANLEESVGANGSVATGYQYEQNNHSDSQFIQEHLGQMDRQEERTVIVTDGAYSGTGNTQLAADKNLELITTRLTGKPAAHIRTNVSPRSLSGSQE